MSWEVVKQKGCPHAATQKCRPPSSREATYEHTMTGKDLCDCEHRKRGGGAGNGYRIGHMAQSS
eukprot:45935-Eustigmatos_ZCMA.PRE.1